MEIQLHQDVLNAIRPYHLPRYDEVPDVGLYLKQAAKYINTYMEPFCGMEITESMISNYVKQHLVDSPRKKLYDRDRLAYLMFITVVKSVLSLDNIRLLIDIQKQTYDNRVAYDYFCCEFENVLQFVYGIKTDVETVGKDANEVKFLLRKIIIAATYKIYLNHCFQNMEKR